MCPSIVYRSGFDAAIVDAEARREALRGFVIGIFDVGRLFAPLARAASQQQLAFRISDATPGEAERVLAGALRAGAAPSMSQEVEFGGRIWRLEMQPGRTDWQAGATLQARLFLGFQVLAAFLVAFATLAGAGRNAATATEVAERTADFDRELRARRAAEAALRASEARLRAILEAALDCIITIDHEGCIVEFNPAAERTFGYRRAQVIGKEMAALMVPPALRERHRRFLATGEGPLLDGRRETRVLRADGTEFPAEIRGYPHRRRGATALHRLPARYHRPEGRAANLGGDARPAPAPPHLLACSHLQHGGDGRLCLFLYQRKLA
jgi:PAS domain S-box-containing protein